MTDIKEELIARAKEIGVKVTPQQAEQFQTYLNMLLERNEVMNLTAITDPHEAVVKHFVDSLTLLKAVEIKKGAKPRQNPTENSEPINTNFAKRQK